MNAVYEHFRLRCNGGELEHLELAEELCCERDQWAGCYFERIAEEVFVPRGDWASAGFVFERAGNACECLGQQQWAAKDYGAAAEMYEQAGLTLEAREARSLASNVQSILYM